MDKRIQIPVMQAITETFGYDKKGTHLKKCEICECEYEESNDLNYLILNGPAECPNCKDILALKEILTEHSNKFFNSRINDPVQCKNMIKNGEYNTEFGKTETYTLDKCEEKRIPIKRTKRVIDIIEKITTARDFLYMKLEAKIQLLKSIYQNKDRFWLDGGNLVYHINEVTVEYVVIKLNEFLATNANNYKYSISKIRNMINNNKKAIYIEQKIILERKFKKSGDIQRIEYPRFEIEKYLLKLDAVLDGYRNIINAIDDYRDSQFAHIGEHKKSESEAQLTYQNIIKIFNSLKIIYDGFLYSVAPDLFTNKSVNFNVLYGRLNRISQYYYDNVTKIHDAKKSVMEKR